jgi:hypothetical protein
MWVRWGDPWTHALCLGSTKPTHARKRNEYSIPPGIRGIRNPVSWPDDNSIGSWHISLPGGLCNILCWVGAVGILHGQLASKFWPLCWGWGQIPRLLGLKGKHESTILMVTLMEAVTYCLPSASPGSETAPSMSSSCHPLCPEYSQPHSVRFCNHER